jgi:diadenosine tetraphosphate (Ap4A) HIT family hydrolase
MDNCLICERIDLIKRGQNKCFVKELKTGFVVLGDHQFYQGYTLFLCKKHKREIHELEEQFRRDFLFEMSIVAEAVFEAFKPLKLNYELLGNTDEHLHWHIFPRHADDPEPKKPVWVLDSDIRNGDDTKPALSKIEDLKLKLKNELDGLLDRYRKK